MHNKYDGKKIKFQDYSHVIIGNRMLNKGMKSEVLCRIRTNNYRWKKK